MPIAHSFRCSSKRLSPQNTLVLAVVAIIAFGALLFGSHVVQSHAQALAFAGTRASAAARLMDEHAHNVLNTTQVTLHAAKRYLVGKIPPDRNALQSSWSSLHLLSLGLPEAGAIWITDASGTSVLQSDHDPSVAWSFSNQPFFAALRDQKLDTHFGAANMGSAQVFTVALRLEDEFGEFGGIIVATISTGYFQPFHANLNLGPGSNSGIFGLDGRIILRQPHTDHTTLPPDAPVLRAAQDAQEGVVLLTSPLDNVERILAFRILPDLGLMVTAGVTREDALAEWKTQTATNASAMVLILLLVTVLSVLAYQSLEREQALVKDLEARVRDRTAEAEARAEEARLANASKSRYLAAASHDLRQPMQAVTIFADVLRGLMNEPRQIEILGKLVSGVTAANDLLNMLMDASSLDNGKLVATMQPMPLSDLFAKLTTQMQPLCMEKGLSLRVVPSAAIVRSDPTVLERIIRNLLVNAIRYTPQGGILLGCRRHGTALRICVVDTGIGIPAEKIDAIFEEFVRLHDQDSLAPGGLGLGLAVVRGMAQLLDHEIGVTSFPGKGSTFWVAMPRM